MSAEQFRKVKGMSQPSQVQKARTEGNTAALSAMGKRGAQVTNAKRARVRIEDEMIATHRAEEHFARQAETGEVEVPDVN
jgi:hypothetical protein